MSNLRTFDLNLLVAFEVLMQEQNVTRAAEKMFITQSAMSHVLHRLRQQLDEPLLVRTPQGMKPSEKALALIGPVKAVLREVEHIIAASAEFDPEKSQRRFVLAATDYMEYLMLPALIQRISRVAPGIDIHVQRTESRFPEAELENYGLDVVLGFEAVLKPPAHLCREKLFDDRMACIVRKDLPGVGDEISLEEYVDMTHLLISRTGSKTGLVDAWLATQGLERRIGLIVPHFLSAPLIVAKTDMVLSLPLLLAKKFTELAPVKILRVPLDLPVYDLVMIWHLLRAKEPAHRWLREQIVAVSGDFRDANGRSRGIAARDTR